MELFQLRYFLEVARQQHVRKSAESLHVSQPAVTNAIHRLENEIGVPLFVSSGRSIRLSPYGKFLYDEILPFCESLNSLPDRIKSLRSLETATIRLNVFAAWFLVMEAVREFQCIDTDLRVQVVQNEHMELADISVSTVHHYRSRKKKTDSLYVCTEPIYLAVPDIPRFRGKDSVSLHEVADLGFIQLTDKKYFRTICDGFCAEAGIYPHTVVESDDPSVVRNMICDNMGVGFWPEFSWGNHHTGSILLKEIEKPECSRDIIIEKRNANNDNIHVQVFYDYLIRYMEIYRKKK